jgi:hypothetical protein
MTHVTVAPHDGMAPCWWRTCVELGHVTGTEIEPWQDHAVTLACCYRCRTCDCYEIVGDILEPVIHQMSRVLSGELALFPTVISLGLSLVEFIGLYVRVRQPVVQWFYARAPDRDPIRIHE